ncbi:MAG: copper resistance protein NlpE [Bacteroidetes bacterium]|nr:copper resistance protein NlpE [Bacteroidota bacterium]MCL1969072.1 copper resistance protein NlpE [Bacteroidota bacterium]
MKKIVFILSIACLLLSLSACKSCGGSSEQNQIATGDNSQTCLDWEGTYSGILPCADCEGIETNLILKMDNTYQISWKYMGKDDEIYTHEGTFVWDATGNIITLENMDVEEYPTMYKVCENYLLQLDLSGNVITGELADKYILTKN